MRSDQKSIPTSSIVNIILIGSSLVTLIFWTSFSDPFGPIKLIIVITISLWALGHLILDSRKLLKNRELKFLLILISMFVFSQFISTLNSSVKQIAWLGEYQRNNGFLFYFALCIIFIATAFYFKESDLVRFSSISFILGLLISAYGLFQINGIDFVKWNNPYNAIISTVGNPNFAGAILATMGVLSLGFAFVYQKNKIRCITFLLLLLVISFTTYLSEARQGLIGLIIGTSFIIGVFIYGKSRIIGRIYFVGISVLGIFAILGMLQMGPLSQILYKGSVTVRGYYWRAGIEMFLSRPWFGIGTDYYGGYFKQFRDVGYPLNYGFEITSTNSHNVFIQIFATSGIFSGVTYLILVFYIFWRGLKGLRRLSVDKRAQLSTIFGAWLTLQSISVISIDSPGVSIWSWVLAGMIIAQSSSPKVSESLNQNNYYPKSFSKSSASQILLSCILLIPIFMTTVKIANVESLVYTARKFYNPKSEENSKYLLSFIPELSKSPFINTLQITELASFLATSGYAQEGIELLNFAISKDPRNLDAINLLANYYFELNLPEKAIPLRLRIIELDPFNAKNYYQLGLIYKLQGDEPNMRKMKEIIQSFAKSTSVGTSATKDLVL
jgi:O-antigen ligase